MSLRLSSYAERIRSSLFFVPMLAVVGATVLGLALLAIDDRVDTTASELPLGLTSTVDSARTLLGAIAGATISFAGVAFSVSLLIIQLASSQYSPRVVHTLFRDPFNKRVMALVVGTFTYCIVVLRSVRSAVDSGSDPVIPNISVAIAVILGIATILAIVAFIDHSAHTMDVSEILERIRRETAEQIATEWEPSAPDRPTEEIPPPPSGPATVLRAHRSGWVQQIDAMALLDCLPAGRTARVETAAGLYVLERSRLVLISPAIDAADLESALRAAFAIGETRTMQQDVTYGLRQIVDVALKALSPGVNDPTTAQDAMCHAAAVLADLLRHDPPPGVFSDDDRRVVMTCQPSHTQLIRGAFDEIRRAAAPHPTVCLYLLDTLESLIELLEAEGFGPRTTELDRQARLVAAGCGRSTLVEDDIDTVAEAYAQRFSRPAP